MYYNVYSTYQWGGYRVHKCDCAIAPPTKKIGFKYTFIYPKGTDVYESY